MNRAPPGAYRPLVDLWGPFRERVRALPDPALVLLDERVGRLHPAVRRELQRRAFALVSLRAGEGAKTTAALEKVVASAIALPRSGWVVCVGGGTLGDLATVTAHLLKRGVSLIQVPTTLLAAVDSSVGGKGALHAGSGRRTVKNAIGAFHYPDACWICPELLATLSPKQLREGRIEAWKMVAALDARRWSAYRRRAPGLEELIRDARELKASVCARDPYEKQGLRRVLNFGHTFGHALESATSFRLSHGDAVGLGILCALDVGRAIGVTPGGVASELEAGLREGAGALPRSALAEALRGCGARALSALLAADKKAEAPGEVRMVLAEDVGRAKVHLVPPREWRRLAAAWRRGARP